LELINRPLFTPLSTHREEEEEEEEEEEAIRVIRAGVIGR